MNQLINKPLWRFVGEYSAILFVLTAGTVMGLNHPLTNIHAMRVPHVARYSIPLILMKNTTFLILIFLGSLLTAGGLGVLEVFLNAIRYGEVAYRYNHYSFWSAMFPWLEIIALIIVTQTSIEVFLAIWRRQRFFRNWIYWNLGLALFLISFAAYVEGGILHV